MFKPREYLYCPFCGRTMDYRTEEGKQRKICKLCNWIHYPVPAIAVAAVITEMRPNLEPCVLMVKRNREPFKGTWMFPAGFLEFGETPQQALIREVKEETGLNGRRLRYLDIKKADSDPRSPEHLVIYYQAQADGEISNNDSDENQDVQWISLQSDANIGFPHHREIFNMLRDNIRKYLD